MSSPQPVPKQMFQKPASTILRVLGFSLSAGTAICGCVIAIAGWRVRTEMEGPYKSNIDAIMGTMTELDRTLVALRSDISTVDAYLTDLRSNNDTVAREVAGIRTQASGLTRVLSKETPAILDDASKSPGTAAKSIKQLANDTANYPLDSIQNARGPMYEISRDMSKISGSLGSVSKDIAKTAEKTGESADKILGSTSEILDQTGKQIATFQRSSLRQVPGTLDALSIELKVHLDLMSSSVNLVGMIILPVVFIGIGLLLAGINGMFRAVFLARVG